jgi:hypothetical protein
MALPLPPTMTLIQFIQFRLKHLILSVIQLLPLTVFLTIARHFEFQETGWRLAYLYGGLTAAIVLAILLWIQKSQINRFSLGVILYLFFGAVSFIVDFHPGFDFLRSLGEAGMILFVGCISLVASIYARTGAFEKPFKSPDQVRKQSLFLSLSIFATFFWANNHVGNLWLAGVAPFVFITAIKKLQEKLYT